MQMLDTNMRKQIVDILWRGMDPFANFPARLYQVDKQGWQSSHPYLADSVEKCRPKIAVEIGVWKGASSITIAEKMRQLSLDAVLISVDTWLGAWDHWLKDEWFPHLCFEYGQPTLFKKFMANVVDAKLTNFIVPLPLDSVNAAEVLKRRAISVDLIHIDGAHDYNSVLGDLSVWWPRLKAGGILIGDDYHQGASEWPEVKKAFDSFFEKHEPLSFEAANGKCRVTKK